MKALFNIFALGILSVLLLSTDGNKNIEAEITSNQDHLTQLDLDIAHATWDALLKKYVDNNGLVDYQGFLKDHSEVKAYLSVLGANQPSKNAPKQKQLAYYINLYNAATIHMMLKNDIPESIKDIGSIFKPVWNQDIVEIAGKQYSLNDIEKGILQKMGDPRIHFAINCASYSCPKLQNTAFTEENVDKLMSRAALEFINSDKNDLSDPANPKLSRIFKWYKSDFTDSGLSLIDYINQYAEKKIDKRADISYLEYDWSINKQ